MRQTNMKLKGNRLIFILALLFLVGLVWAGYSLLDGNLEAVDKTDHKIIDVEIPTQSTARQIAAILLDYDLIHSEKSFLNYCKKTGIDGSLKAGHYKFSRSQSLKEIAHDIAEGKIANIAFTIPEGYTVEQIGTLLISQGLSTEEEWQAAINQQYDYDFLNYDNNNIRHHLEGFLFPDTYKISENTEAYAIIELMLNNFERVWQDNFMNKVSDKDIYEIITIASMIEKEAAVAKDRPTISGVIQNRLDIGMPLQIDATVLYALGQHKEIVYNVDLTVNSPYNTYKYGGLPVGPIASPGKESIAAAINPEKHGYYYYVARGDGSHYFTKNHDEHLRAKAKYIN